MKSRWTTYLLLAAVAAVWGVVAWRIVAPARPDAANDTPAAPTPPPAAPLADTLRLGYPDPFLKGAPKPQPPPRPVVRPLPPPKKAARQRKATQIVHLATVAAAGSALHILMIGREQYELRAGDTAAGFRLLRTDRDSLYLECEGFTYGVKRCE